MDIIEHGHHELNSKRTMDSHFTKYVSVERVTGKFECNRQLSPGQNWPGASRRPEKLKPAAMINIISRRHIT